MFAVLAIPLLIILTAYVAYALANLQHSQSTGFLGWLASAAENLPIFGGFSAKQILKMDAYLTRALGSHFQQVERKAVAWLVGLKQYAGWMAAAAVAPAAAMWAFSWWMVHTEVPRLIRGRTKHIEQTATGADAKAEAAAKAAAGIAKSHPGKVTTKEVTQIQRVAMPHAEEWSWINHHWKALTHAVTHPVAIPGVLGLPVPLRWFGRTARQLRAHNRRLARLEKLIGVGTFAAVLASTLGVSLRCARPGGNLGRLARAACGAPSWLLRFLVAGVVEAFILSDLCDFSDLLIVQTEKLRPSLMQLVNVENALVGCHDFDAPRVFTLPPVSLPPLVDAVSLAA